MRIKNWTKLSSAELYTEWRKTFDSDDQAIATAIWIGNRLAKNKAQTTRRRFYDIKDEFIRRHLSVSVGRRVREESLECRECAGDGWYERDTPAYQKLCNRIDVIEREMTRLAGQMRDGSRAGHITKRQRQLDAVEQEIAVQRKGGQVDSRLICQRDRLARQVAQLTRKEQAKVTMPAQLEKLRFELAESEQALIEMASKGEITHRVRCENCRGTGKYRTWWLYIHEFEVGGQHYSFHSYQEPVNLSDELGEDKEQFGGKFTEDELTEMALPMTGLIKILDYVAVHVWGLIRFRNGRYARYQQEPTALT